MGGSRCSRSTCGGSTRSAPPASTSTGTSILRTLAEPPGSRASPRPARTARARRAPGPAPHRDGGQAQFIDRSLPSPTAHTLAGTRDRALRRLDEALPLDEPARHQWLLTARVNHARELLPAAD
ncbi:hypothetical protein [Streptomyces sp. NPDC001601]|uniref:hypothetical protein n=1 Tax=Streptomyces sp. NPDC001601 TaxID=3364592 RepID=UPI0036D1572B